MFVVATVSTLNQVNWALRENEAKGAPTLEAMSSNSVQRYLHMVWRGPEVVAAAGCSRQPFFPGELWLTLADTIT